MSRKATLRAFLSPQRLKELASPKVYARGEAYFADGNVLLHEHTRDEAIADIMGTQPYRVELKLTSSGLIADCTCPAMSDYGFCKHAVALGLNLINGRVPAKKTAETRQVEPDGFTAKYPSIAGWIEDGWIEIGRDGYSTSVIRVLDEGGLIWEGRARHKSMDKSCRKPKTRSLMDREQLSGRSFVLSSSRKADLSPLKNPIVPWRSPSLISQWISPWARSISSLPSHRESTQSFFLDRAKEPHMWPN